MARVKDGLLRSKNTNLLKSQWWYLRIGLHAAASQLKRNTLWLRNQRRRDPIKRKVPQRFILEGTYYQNDDNKRIQQETFVKIKCKNIALLFVDDGRGKERKDGLLAVNRELVSPREFKELNQRNDLTEISKDSFIRIHPQRRYIRIHTSFL